MIKISLKDGNTREFEKELTVFDAAVSISEGLARVALAAKVDGKLVDLSFKIKKDCTLEILTYRDEEGKEVYRHTTAHVLAQAVKNIYPTAKLGMGPAIKNGFYYDFEFKTSPTQEDLVHIEKEMQRIIKADLKLEHTEMSKKKALVKMAAFDEPYKVELIKDMPASATVSFYTQGEFTDMCAGPHLPSTGKIKAFKLTSLTGAYWKGSEKNIMLTRIYGCAFDKKSELDEYLTALEEAKKRDHSRLGRELGIFMTDENVGQGLPLILPKGAKILQILQRFVEDEEERCGYLPTRTPIMSKHNLYEMSGHWSHYRDKMFYMPEGKDVSRDFLALRPMTCPGQFLIYKNGLKSYRDLPIRYNETATLYRKEASGEMHGLLRVWQFTLSDGHILCTPDQLEEEFLTTVELTNYILDCLGLRDEVSYRFSKNDPKDTEKYIDNPVAWESTQKLMKGFLDKIGLEYVEAEGEAAFYGPKLDIQCTNVYGKEDTIITIQIDFAMADRFDLCYVDASGEKKRPLIIHRSSVGAYERTLAMLIEKYAGAFPMWLSPTQVRVMSLTDRVSDGVKATVKKLREHGIRAEADIRNEKIGYKIREAQLEKIPYMLIIGDKEHESGTVSVRSRKDGDLGVLPLEEFIQSVEAEAQPPKRKS